MQGRIEMQTQRTDLETHTVGEGEGDELRE